MSARTAASVRVAKLVALAAFVVAGGGAIAHAAGTASRPLRAPTTWVLPNGLKVLFVAGHEAQLASVSVLYHAGSRDEQPDERGAARVVQALMARGSERVAPGAHDSLLRQLGGAGDALTTTDVATFVSTGPASAMPFLLALEADRMRGLVFSADGFAAARTLVIDERRARVDGHPVARARELVRADAFGPSASPTLATQTELGALTREACKRFYDRLYVPSNALLVVVADASPARVRADVTAAFGRIPRGGARPARPADPPVPSAGPLRVVPASGPGAVVMTAFRVPRAAEADRAALEAIVNAVAVGPGSRLGVRFTGPDGPASAAGGVLEWDEAGGLLVVFVVLPDAALAPNARKLIEAELDGVRARGITNEELTHVRLELAARAARELQTTEGLATQVALGEATGGGAARALAWPDRFTSLALAEVTRAAAEHLVEAKRFTVQIGGVLR